MAEKVKPRNTKIAIIGAGVAGLTLAICLKRIIARYKLPFQLVIYEASKDHSDFPTHSIVLWKWAVEALLEMGFGKRLSRISWPVVSFESIDGDAEKLVSWPPLEKSFDEEKYSYLPPMIALRKVDLIRMFLTSLAGRDDLVMGDDLTVQPANNADGTHDATEGIEADLASSDWFHKEFSEILKDIKYGFVLESFVISASFGTTNLKFKNGYAQDHFMVLGADGIGSPVRELLFNARFPPQHTNTTIVSGVSRVLYPPPDSPSEYQVDRTRILNFCPDGTLKSFVDKTVSFGCVNLGNGMMGWNLIARGPESQIIGSYLVRQKRSQIHEATKNAPKAPGVGLNRLKIPEELPREESVSSSKDWLVPSSKSSSMNEIPEEKAEKLSLDVNVETSPVYVLTPPSTKPPTSTELYGADARCLALELSAQYPSLPNEAKAIIATTDPGMTAAYDSYDLLENPDSCTSQNFHPGRIIILGDAAHACALGPHGSDGCGLAITDAITLAKLIGHHLKFVATATDDVIQDSLQTISKEYDKYRTGLGKACVNDARAECSWVKSEGYWKGFLKNTVGYTWVKSTFKQMLRKGETVLDEKIEWPSIRPLQ